MAHMEVALWRSQCGCGKVRTSMTLGSLEGLGAWDVYPGAGSRDPYYQRDPMHREP